MGQGLLARESDEKKACQVYGPRACPERSRKISRQGGSLGTQCVKYGRKRATIFLLRITDHETGLPELHISNSEGPELTNGKG